MPDEAERMIVSTERSEFQPAVRKVPRKWPAILALIIVLVVRFVLNNVATPLMATLPVAFVALLLWAFALRAAPQGGRSLVDEIKRWRRASRGLDRDDLRRIRRAVKRREQVDPRLARPAAAWAHRRVMTSDFGFWIAIATGATLQVQLMPSLFPFVFYTGVVLVPVSVGLAYVARRRRADREVLRDRREAARNERSHAPEASGP